MRMRTTRNPCSLNVLQTWGRGVLPITDPRPAPGQIFVGGSSHLWLSCRQGYPTGIHVSREQKKQKLEKSTELKCCSMHGMTSMWPSSIHFSPGDKCIYAAKDGKLGLSFLTWFPTPTFQICCTCKKNFCRQPACFFTFSFSTLMNSLCGVERRQDGFFPPYMPAQMQASIAHSILKPVLCSLGFHVWG